MDSRRALLTEATLTPRQRHGYRTAAVSADPTTEAHRDRQFEIEFLDSGVEAFSFTFGDGPEPMASKPSSLIPPII
jgi:hypothetical protein